MINKRYILSRKLGEGRSKVFGVIDTEFPEREVAAKFLPVSASYEEKDFFREEYFILQNLDHPNIIKSFELSTVFIADEDEDIEVEKFSQFITMEYFPPNALLNYSGLKEEKKLNQIIKQICSVLYYLHQSNYIYYDLKAENILVSESDGNPIIKIIDLGFARHTSSENLESVLGTPFYIAPELLKKESHDHKVDFYSLGMLLYRIVYGKFPFVGKNEIDIYKAQIEEEFDLGTTIYSKKIVNVISKLIKKNPADRYENALQIILDLQLPIDFEVVKDLVPAKVFSDRKDAFNILTTYINDKTSNEVFSVTGFDGSGKTSLMLELYRKHQFSVYVENSKIKTGLEAVKYIFHKIILTEAVYNEKQDNYDQIINDIFKNSSLNFLDSVKKIFNTLPSSINFTVILDDYNLYDDFTKDSLTEVIRIFQVKGIKIILTESSDFDHSSASLNNLCDVQLNQFTDHQLTEFLDLSYYSLFPRKELKKYILLYSDLQPGNIKQFIKDLILLNVMRFENGDVSFQSSEEIILALQSSHEELYRMRLSNLNSKELKLAQIIASFDIAVEQTILAALLNVSHDGIKLILNELEKKNIIDPLNLSNAPKINSFNFKKYIYSTINNRVKFHLVLANSIKKLFADFNVMELARQFELANEFEQSVDYLKKEMVQAESISAFTYKRSLLERALRLNIKDRTFENLSLELVKILYKISDYKLALENIYRLNASKYSVEENSQIQFIKGSSLIELRKTQEGIATLSNLKPLIKDNWLKNKILVEISYAKFDLGDYESAKEYSNILLSEHTATLEDQGRILNLLSLIEYHQNGLNKKVIDFGLSALKKYETAQLPSRISGIHVNIGAFFDILGETEKADNHWKKAIEINSSIGNLEQLGTILINYGVFHHAQNKYESAIEDWQEAQKIFSSIGMQNNLAIAIGNMGEIYLQTCDYQNAYDSLIKAFNIFNQLKSKEEAINILYFLGKYWFAIGDLEELDKTVNQFEYFLLTEEKPSERNNLQFIYLKFLKGLIANNSSELINQVALLLNESKKLSDSNIYVEVNNKISEYLINSKKINDAFTFLSDEDYIKFTDQNVIFKAQREYLFGKIAYYTQNEKLKSPIDYFESAYYLIENESISELTWKVLYTIAEIYWERGNFHKAKKPRHYAYELINMIGENISNSKIRSTYFNQPERKQAIEKLLLIGTQTQINEFQKS